MLNYKSPKLVILMNELSSQIDDNDDQPIFGKGCQVETVLISHLFCLENYVMHGFKLP